MRTLAHLVAKCHARISNIYDISHWSKKEKKENITKLLEGNLFFYRGSIQQVRRRHMSALRF